MAFEENVTKEIAIRMILGLAVAFFLYEATSTAWDSSTTYVSIHALIAFLAIASAAWAFLVNYRDTTVGHWIFFTGLFVRVVIHSGTAVEHAFGGDTPLRLEAQIRVTTDIFGVALFSIFILASVLSTRAGLRGIIPRMTMPTIGITGLAAFGILYFFILPSVNEFGRQVLGLVFGVIAIAAFLSSCILWISTKEKNRMYSTPYMLSSLFAFTLSILPLIMAQISFSSIWRLSFWLQALGFAFMALAIGEPLYRRVNISKKSTNTILTWTLTLAIGPFIVALFAEGFAPGILIIDFGAYLLSHGAAAMLSAMMAILLYVYFKRNPAWNLVPLLTLFLSWTVIEIYIMSSYSNLLIGGRGESVVPYILGGIVSLLVIFQSVVWTTNPPSEEPPNLQVMWIGTRLSFVVLGLLTSMYIENSILAAVVSLVGSPIGRSVLLVINLAALAGFLILLHIMTREYGDWKSIQGIALLFLGLWIMPNILKGVFLDWTVGWWAAEVLLIIGLALGPPLLGSLYVDSMSSAQDSQRRATLYSDLLAHDITNMHQAILVALSILEMEGTDDVARNLAIIDARTSLNRAALIVENVRQIGLADQTGKEELTDKDLVASIIDAFNQVKSEFPDEELNFSVNSREGHCFILANNLLMDLFYNLFKNALAYSENEKRVEVTINYTKLDGEDFWRIRVADHGRGIEEERKAHLFQRFMKGAEGLGLGLSVVLALVKSFGGHIEVEDRVSGDHTKGTVFIVDLPISPNH
ncbi:MAG: HAMP domain-containing histidine kinase [Candidatus Thorarchaeota archaeon]|nr:HAMP domain-containing histidine kinase [Candidatus Thorarchaeota archaeon]